MPITQLPQNSNPLVPQRGNAVVEPVSNPKPTTTTTSSSKSSKHVVSILFYIRNSVLFLSL